MKIRQSRECFVYVHGADYRGRKIAKIGRSFSPQKRLKEFNNGLRWRHRLGHAECCVSFVPVATMRTPDDAVAKRIERDLLRKYSGHVLSQFGVEVLDVHPDAIADEFAQRGAVCFA